MALRTLLSALLALAALTVGAHGRAAAQEPFDILITDARVVDGTGAPWYRADIGIRGGRIAEIGTLDGRSARRTIAAEDRVVAPGFIDLMNQSTALFVADRVTAESRLRQGITTAVSGEGWSHAPQNERTQRNPATFGGQPVRWRTFAEYFALLERHGLALNVVHNVGAAQVRRVVLGDEDVDPTPEQLQQMRRLVEQAMEDGAIGISTSLIYPPGNYADTDELVALSEIAARHGGIYLTHMRNESNRLLESIDEALEIGRRAGIPVHIYHLKAAGRDNWPLMERAIAKIEDARRTGMDVTADIYPYIRNGIGLGAFLAPRHYARGAEAFLRTLSDPAVRARLRREVETGTDYENWYRHVGSDWGKVLITGAGSYPGKVAGLSVAEAAAREGKSAWDMFFDLVQAGGVSVAPESMNEEQKHMALRAPFVMLETDTEPVNPATAESTHPRAMGAFPRVIAKYVMEDSVLTMEQAIQRMTSLPANRLGLHDRGRIAPGMAADLIVFDPARLRDRATFENPLQYAEGVDYLLVNGQLAIDDGRMTDALGGAVLRR